MRIGLLVLAASVAACSTPSRGSYPSPMARAPRAAQEHQAADDTDETKLAKASQNPIADLVSLPLQNNTNLDWGPDDETQNILNIQPVIPFALNDDWNVITRTILPVVSQPVPGGSDEFGFGDTTFTAFFSPRDTEGWTWGVGPVLLLPTSSDDALGVGEWGGGASFVALTMTGPWVAGGLVSNVWSFESNDVNSFLLQPFVNYNLQDGWYLTTAPIVTANWDASSDERWTIPIGGGAGRVFKIGKQAINVNLQYYSNVEHPTFGAESQVRFQFQFLFPKG